MAVETATAPAAAAPAVKATVAAQAIPTTAIVHPLVLLSATDHYMRVAKDTKKRVVGVLLGAKEVAGERDTWKTTTHENAVRLFLPSCRPPQGFLPFCRVVSCPSRDTCPRDPACCRSAGGGSG